MSKPIIEWALNEIKAMCAGHSDCYTPEKCPFLLEGGSCRLGSKPFAFKLSEEDYK